MCHDDLVSYLSALQLGDSAFPSGRYTLSYGLEAVAQSGQLTTKDHPDADQIAQRQHPLRCRSFRRGRAGLRAPRPWPR
jgi:urease accessory protein UreF